MSPKGITKGAGINHLNLVRVRVQGSGSLKVKALSYSVAKTHNFTNITMETNPYKIPTSKGNFSKQKIQIEVKTEAINEWFKIGEIIPFIRPSGTSYPNG